MAEGKVGSGSESSETAAATDAVQQDLFHITSDAEALYDEVVEARVGAIGARCRDDVGDLGKVQPGFLDGFLRCGDGQGHAFIHEEFVKLFY